MVADGQLNATLSRCRSLEGLVQRRAADLKLALTLDLAWAARSRFLDGLVLAGASVTELLGYLNFEFKRQGLVVPIPPGLDAAHRLALDERSPQWTGRTSPWALVPGELNRLRWFGPSRSGRPLCTPGGERTRRVHHFLPEMGIRSGN